jgi:hypothetical protein
MVHDSGTSKSGKYIYPKEPIVYEPPDNSQIEQEIVNVATAHPEWGRLTIHKHLEIHGHNVSQAVVNFVLAARHLPNLHLGS